MKHRLIELIRNLRADLLEVMAAVERDDIGLALQRLEDVVGRLRDRIAGLHPESTEPAPARLEAAGTGSDRKDGTTT